MCNKDHVDLHTVYIYIATLINMPNITPHFLQETIKSLQSHGGRWGRGELFFFNGNPRHCSHLGGNATGHMQAFCPQGVEQLPQQLGRGCDDDDDDDDHYYYYHYCDLVDEIHLIFGAN